MKNTKTKTYTVTPINDIESVKADYEYFYPYMTNETVPLEKETGTKEVQLVKYDKTITIEEIIADMKLNGLKPASPNALLGFAKEHFDVMEKYQWLVAPSSVFQDERGDRCFLCVYRGDGERKLDLVYVDVGWDADGGWMFLAEPLESDSETVALSAFGSMKTTYKDIKITEIREDSLIKDSKLFSYVDSDFTNYGASEKYPDVARARNFSVLELTEDMTFEQMFTNPESQWMTQGQILSFVEDNKDKLSKEWYTFFLFKSKGKFFVARVRVDSDGLDASVRRFEDGRVWGAGPRRRVVVPQFDASPLGTETLNPLETLSLTDEQCIEQLKANGYKITKLIETENKKSKIISLSSIAWIELREITITKTVYHLTDGTEVIIN